MKKTSLHKKLTLHGAKAYAAKAAQKAHELNVPGAIAVVDAWGSLIYLEVLDGTMPAAANITIGKAATAAAFRRPTHLLESLIQEKRMVMQNLSGIPDTPYVPLAGAYPIEEEGEIVGAIGIGGAHTGENDEIIAQYAVGQ